MFYDLFYLAAAPVFLPRLIWRMIRSGRYREGWKEKLLGRAGLSAPRGRRIWVHAVSVGEVSCAVPLVAALDELDGVEVVVSTTTETGQAVARKRFGRERVFYCPFDFAHAVSAAFDRVRPEVLVLVELEIWPNMIAEARRRKVPAVVVNGRMSQRSFRGYARVLPFISRALRSVWYWSVQTEEYARRLRSLGVPAERIGITSSLKYDAASLEPDHALRARIRDEFGIGDDEVVLVAGSTHRGEEEAVLDAAGEMRVILAPRHPERWDEVEELLKERGFNYVRRTRLGEPAGPQPVILLDTMGELSSVYQAAEIVFVGGSLVPRGGQNPIEPASVGKPVVFGPNMWNFDEAKTALLDAGAAMEVRDRARLIRVAGDLADSHQKRRRMGLRAREVVVSRRGATRANVRLVENALEKRLGRK